MRSPDPPSVSLDGSQVVETARMPHRLSYNDKADDGATPGVDAFEEGYGHDGDSSTDHDASNMRRMGVKQELVRHFRTLSMISFVALASASWELAVLVATPGLTNGGRPGLIYSCLWAFVGYGPVYLSMAEMASMAPVAGAQYHWVSEFAPERYQKVLSYLTGWTSTVAWQAGCAQGIFVVGSLAQAIIAINIPSYGFPSWHCTLFVIAFTLMTLSGNIYGARVLPLWQNAVFALQTAGFLVFVILVWVNAPKATSRQVWLEWENYGGWSSMALSVMVGQLSAVSGQVGSDTAAHMSEEMQDAAVSVPRAMLLVFLINFVFVITVTVTLCYAIPDVAVALKDSSTYPGIYVLRQSVSDGWVTVVLVLIMIMLLFGDVSYTAAASRDLFAFARDKGLPFSEWISRVDESLSVPKNALILSSFFTFCLSLIYIGSPVAFYAITSLVTVALLQCYSLSIGCLLWRRIYEPQTLPPARFSLGRLGVPMNALAVLFSLWCFFWGFWPQNYPVTAADFNWASPIFVAVLVIAVGYYVPVGRKRYHGPVVLVEGRKLGASKY